MMQNPDMVQANQVQNIPAVNKVILYRLEVVDCVWWNSLGPGIVCQVDNCGNLAYKYCDKTLECGTTELFKGCGKAMCLAHC